MPRSIAILVAAAVLVLGANAAYAKPKRKVRIDSDPPGATVYIGDKKAGKKGTTPVTLNLPTGETTIILELDGYLDHIESVSIEAGKGRAGRSPQKLSFALDKAVGTIRLSGLPDGAKVTVDGNEVSTLDSKIEVDPGAHEVVVKAGGKQPFDQWIEVSAGEEKKVDVALGGGDGGGAEGEGEVEHHDEKPAGPSEKAPHPWYGTAGVSYEVGWRRFRYDNPQTTNLRPFDANGVGMIDFWGELAPWRATGAHILWPLSITAGFGIGLPVTATAPNGDTADTYWRTTEVGLRWRWNVTHEAAIDFEGGWARLLYTFRDSMNGLISTIPDVDYEMVRLGLRGVAKIGKGRLWIAGDNRIILSGGEEQNRFRGGSMSGLSGHLGGDVPFLDGRLILRVEGNVQRYGWTFNTQPGDMYIADGASDVLFGFNIGLGGSY